MPRFQKGFLYRARFPQTDLEAMLDRARAELMESGPESLVSWSDNGTNASKQIEMTVAEWLDELVYSLELLDPDKYEGRHTANVTTAGFPGRFQ